MPQVKRTAPNERHVQSYLFSVDKWSKADCSKWLKNRQAYRDGYHRADEYHRWRQYDPQDKFNYRTETRENGRREIVGYPK